MVSTARSGLIALSLATAASAALHEVWYNITTAMVNPDGLFEREVIGVNGTWPPPPLDVQFNDTVLVHVHNGLTEPTAIHHHGIYFNKTAYYDGAPGITQCGIPPGADFTYEVPVDLQWGTYWWHSHVGAQYVDGLRAPNIIHNTVEAHQYDEEYTVVLADWYHEQHSVLNDQFMSVWNPTGAEPVPQSALIYFAQNGTYLPGFNMNTSLSFTPGKTYRLRIMNTGAFSMFYFWIDGHQMRIIEADGTDTEEMEVDHVALTVAQRYSVLVTARNDTTENFLIHANFDSSMFDTFPDDLQLNYTSPIIYDPASPTAPQETRDVLDMTPDHLLVPTIPEVQQVATHNIELGIFFDTFDDGINRAAFNNITFQYPKVPTIFTQTSMGANASDVAVYGSQTHAFVLEKDEVVDVMLINWDANGHPFHLHGHKFQIVRVATDVASDDPELNPPHTEGAPNPMRRDTVYVPDGGAVNIRFVADNPGTWLLHCHIEWHLEAGLAVVFAEAPTESQTDLQIPQFMYDQCAALGTPSSGNAVGKFSTTDLEGQVLGPFPQVPGFHSRGAGALAGTILAALLGMATVVWYAFGGQLDAEDLDDEVRRELEQKKDGGIVKRGFKKGLNGLRRS